jgi:ABC-2 type transport system ATP-binding protein
MKCILGFLRYSGEILLERGAITHRNIARLSFAPGEHSFFPNLSPPPTGNSTGCISEIQRKTVWRANGFFQLPMHKALRHFSAGQKNQFEVILSLSQGADYILMDEPFAGNDVFNREDFYKVLSGILEPEETVLLSTHLLEEVENFIGRAVLLRQGKIVGDISALALQESGKSLLAFVKETYSLPAGPGKPRPVRPDRRGVRDNAEEFASGLSAFAYIGRNLCCRL